MTACVAHGPAWGAGPFRLDEREWLVNTLDSPDAAARRTCAPRSKQEQQAAATKSGSCDGHPKPPSTARASRRPSSYGAPDTANGEAYRTEVRKMYESGQGLERRWWV